MSDTSFQALVVRETADGGFSRAVEPRRLGDLSTHEVLIRVDYSSLNFKDALSATGVKRVTAQFPHTPGIDAAGRVVESASPLLRAGDEVLVTGYDLGMNTAGGFAQYIRVPAAWVIKRPPGLGAREAMIYGTAGLTAGLSVLRLQQHRVLPGDGPVLVTGASGGVGSIATAILCKAGYAVAAVSGKPRAEAMLRQLGVQEVLRREELDDRSGKVLLRERWAGVVDTVGGNLLATAVKSTRYGGSITACGWVAGAEVPITMYPFMIRAVNLLGIDSVQCPMADRRAVWDKLADDWKSPHLATLATEVGLTAVSPLIDQILQGALQGRYVVDVNR